jgi:tRNA (guanine26-N2/guanine27-N2)-dimethyltransferase
LLSIGYKVSQSHAFPQSIKTDAPPQAVWDVLRKWCELHPIKGTISESSPAQKILKSKPRYFFDLRSNDISFELNSEWEPLSSKLNLVRYQPNPTPNWGPQARPGKEQKPAGLTKKTKANQEKRATSPIIADPKKHKGI